jgi:hypothetical protein
MDEPTSQVVPSGVWTQVEGARLSVYQDSGRNVAVTVEDGVVTLPEGMQVRAEDESA